MASQTTIAGSLMAMDSIRKKYETVFQPDRKNTPKASENESAGLITSENKSNYNKYLGRYIDIRV